MSSQHLPTNQSGESGVSSLQRSGLNISVGDTKSIVLALQALQQKIRALEQDRDYHQDQYERTLHAHEAYKLDVERQLEEERAAHRKREHDLAELLRKALEDKKRLENSYGSQNDDLANFRKELESMIAAEKQNARRREETLEGEVEKLRAAVKDERVRYTTLAQTVERLKRERHDVDEINEQLRLAMDDLLTQEEDKRRRRRAGPNNVAAAVSGARVNSRTGYTAPPAPRGGRPAAPAARSASGRSRVPRPSATCANSARRSHSEGQRVATVPDSRRYSYEEPTVNSLLRDVRNVSGDVPCHHDGLTGDGERPPTASAPGAREGHSMLSAPASPGDRSGRSARPVSAHGRDRATPNRSVQGDAPTVSGVRAQERRTAPAMGASPSSGAIPEVEHQLKAELDDLQAQYQDTILRASSEDIPRDVLSSALNKISALIDHKLEQLRLIRGAQREMEAVTNAGGNGPHPDTYFDAHAKPLSADELGKATQRSLLVNELRSLLANSAAH